MSVRLMNLLGSIIMRKTTEGNLRSFIIINNTTYAKGMVKQDD